MAIFDALTARVLRRLNRRVLNFPQEDEALHFPQADENKRYLLYLHIPYCVVLCPFCSFHRVRFKRDSAEHYFACLDREIEIVSDRGFGFDEVYVGGGTPTVLPVHLGKTLERLRERHTLESISVETNPDDLHKDSVRHLRESGVNRLSVGVQSFDDDLLREMQRYEKYGCGADIVDSLKRASGAFDTVNVDMIFNFPHQTDTSLRRDLDILIDAVGADQVSWYPLMAADSTERSMVQTMGQAQNGRERAFYELIVERMLGAGYRRSSAWCFSRKAGMFDEYIVDHEEYVGLGSGAFSYLQGCLFASTFSINHYLKLIEAGRTGTVRQRVMNERDQMHYFLMMRLFSGALDLESAENRFSGRFQSVLWPELSALRLIGAVRRHAGQLTLTENGYFLWVMMMREFFSGVSNLRDAMRHHIAEERPIVPHQ